MGGEGGCGDGVSELHRCRDMVPEGWRYATLCEDVLFAESVLWT